MATRLLIDGYNLLHASDVFASPEGPPTLERTREALLAFLARTLPEKQRRRTTIVFDAAQAPRGLPHQLSWSGMNVLFSRRPQQADDLLEEILVHAKGTRELMVVSSDHRVQRAARQAGAACLDSEAWLAEQKKLLASAPQKVTEKPDPSDWGTSPELAAWLRAFSNEVAKQQPEPPEVKPSPTVAKPIAPKQYNKVNSTAKEVAPNFNPFPPGYGEDLLNDE